MNRQMNDARWLRRTLLTLLLFSGYYSPAQTQQALPEGPLLKAAPAFARWTVTFNYSEDQVKMDPTIGGLKYLNERPRKITTTKTNEIVHEEVTEVNGVTGEKWFVGVTQYAKRPGGDQWFQNEPDSTAGGESSSDYTPLPASGFRDLDWISKNAFAAILPFRGRECLVFVGDGEPDIPLESANIVVYVDKETRLPLALKRGGEVRTYEFSTPPSAKLELPSDLLQQIRSGQEARMRLLQPAARPY